MRCSLALVALAALVLGLATAHASPGPAAPLRVAIAHVAAPAASPPLAALVGAQPSREGLDLAVVLDGLRASRAQSWLDLARQQMQGGSFKEALASLREAHRVQPELAESIFQMARVHLLMGNLGLAQQAHRRYVTLFRSPLEQLLAAVRFGELLDEQRVLGAR